MKPANFELQHLILMSVDKIPSNIDNLDGMFPRKSRKADLEIGQMIGPNGLDNKIK